jgi:hypothetical protein
MAFIYIRGHKDPINITDEVAIQIKERRSQLRESGELKESDVDIKQKDGNIVNCLYKDIKSFQFGKNIERRELKQKDFESLPDNYYEVKNKPGYYGCYNKDNQGKQRYYHNEWDGKDYPLIYEYYDRYNRYGLLSKYNLVDENELLKD